MSDSDRELIAEARDEAQSAWTEAHPPGVMLPDYKVAVLKRRAYLFTRLADTLALRDRQIAGLAEALTYSRDMFRKYAELHAAKNTSDGDSKALSNRAMASICNSALQSLEGEEKT
jgi:hypothetical protein